jgi:hypothetical protein
LLEWHEVKGKTVSATVTGQPHAAADVLADSEAVWPRSGTATQRVVATIRRRADSPGTPADSSPRPFRILFA